jgi:hypothetical protein
MPAVYVTTAELRSNLGIGTLYTDATVEEVCQTAEDLISQYLWHNDAPVVGTALQDNVATLMLANPNAFAATQSYASTPAIREAAMIIAVDIWQARQVSQTGGVGMDGVSASPYRMGYQLINRIRGLIQPYSSPASLVG